MLKLTMQRAIKGARVNSQLPAKAQLQRWAQAAVSSCGLYTTAELTIRIVDEAESSTLNESYRHKQGPTNVLSFPFDAQIPEMDTLLLGDVVICAPLVEREAVEQGKGLMAHWAHLVIHGVLHLQGYDHQTVVEAELMEGLEVTILSKLGYPDPYSNDNNATT